MNPRLAWRIWLPALAVSALALGASVVLPVRAGRRPAALRAAPVPPPAALLKGSRQVPIFAYHRVSEEPAGYLEVTPSELERQLAALRRSGARAVSIGQVYAHLNAGAPLPERSIALTFDDASIDQIRTVLPILRRYRWPALFFVVTSQVTGEQWAELRQLETEAGITLGCHTATHPADLRLLSDADLHRELADSRRILEEKLGHAVPYFSYPSGGLDGRVIRAVQDAGYTMALAVGQSCAGPVEDAFLVPRLLPERLEEVCDYLRRADPKVPLSARVVPWHPAALESGSQTGAVRLEWLRGGRVAGVRTMLPRPVPFLVHASGAAAGINGAFFADAGQKSGVVRPVGPLLSRFGPGFSAGIRRDRRRIGGRPLVVIAPGRVAFVPFSAHLGGDGASLQRLFPQASDAFVGGAWLVSRGRTISRQALAQFHLENAFDARPRSFFGVDRQGRIVLGASATPVGSDRLARAVLGLGLTDAVLLDSGTSTCLVDGGDVRVSGGARPVPHALVLYPPDAPEPDAVCAVGPPELAAALQEEEDLDGRLSAFFDTPPGPDPRRERYARR